MTTEPTNEPTQEERNAVAVTIALEEGWIDSADDLATGSTPTEYDAGAATFLVLTNDEADDAARENIEQSAWAFVSSFLADYMPDGIDASMIDVLRANRSEEVNDAMLALIRASSRGFEGFWEDAVQADGRGHFLSGYDGEELEVTTQDGREWFAYRTN